MKWCAAATVFVVVFVGGIVLATWLGDFYSGEDRHTAHGLFGFAAGSLAVIAAFATWIQADTRGKNV